MKQQSTKEVIDYYELLINSMKKKYPQIFIQIRKLIYHDDKAKVFDRMFIAILDSDNHIKNFRVGRDDNPYSMQQYKNEKIKGASNKQYDSAVYSTKTNVSYYFGFDN